MSPVTQAALIAQAHAEAMVGIALTQLVRKGAPVVYGSFLTTMDLKTGAPTFGTPESSLTTMAISQLCRRLGLPFRCGGHLTASKLADAQAMQESVDTMNPAIMAGANFIFQAAGWLEGGLTIGYEKVCHGSLTAAARFCAWPRALAIDANELAADAYREAGIGSNFPRRADHTLRNYRSANYRAELADTSSFEQWREDGRQGHAAARPCRRCTRMLGDYEPACHQSTRAVDEALLDFIARRKASMTGRLVLTEQDPYPVCNKRGLA